MPLDILLVDDEPTLRLAVADALRAEGHKVTAAADGAEALTRLGEGMYDVVICDILMPKVNGLKVFKRVRQDHPETDIILMTAHGSVGDAVRALKEGATDYLTKPFDPDVLLHDLSRIADRRALQHELRTIRRELAIQRPGPAALVGRSLPMQRLFERLETIADSDAPVLIQGESGTGKELVARTLHQRSSRRNGPFIAVNCAAFPETLLEAELFGHERGAFTGAVRRREGRFKAADGGTLFLDEIGEIPLPAQAKLLRVLQEGTIEPLGSDAPQRVDVRVLSATHRDLKSRIEQGLFREDLYFRIKVLDVRIPPLRKRPGDLPLLVETFLERFAKPGQNPTVGARAWAALSEYAWPGNVRELEHAIHHAVVLSRSGPVDLSHLPSEIAGAYDEEEEPVRHDGEFRPLAEAVREFEREYLMRALSSTGGNRSRAAQVLGISRKNLWEKLKAYGVDADQGRRDLSEATQ